jgi:hypothetical protein
MAMRRDPRDGREPPGQREENQENGLVEFPKVGLPTGVRPEVLATGRKVIEQDRKLLEPLAAYDRGESS